MKKILMVVALAATVVTGLAGRTTKATAEATATIVGNVRGPDGAPISAFVNAVGAHSGLLGTTTAAGHFELTVPADTYKVFALSADQSVSTAAFWYHGTAVDDAELLTATAGAQLVLEDIRLAAGATVSGRITTTAGTPVAGVRVVVQRTDIIEGGFLTTGADGGYRVTRLPAGPYSIEADADGTRGGPVYLGDVHDAAHATTVVLAAGQVLDGQDVHLPVPPPPAHGTVTGVVRLGSGAPIPGAIVRATLSNAVASGPNDPQTTADAQGRYVLDLPPASWAIHFDGGAGFRPVWYRNADSLASAQPVGVAADQTAAGVDGVLTRAAAPLTVTTTSPLVVKPGGTIAATIKGTGFKAHGVTGLTFGSDPGITIAITKVSSDTSAQVTVHATDLAPAMPHDLRAGRDGGALAVCPGCVVVGAGPTGPTISSVTPARLAPGVVAGVDVRGTSLSGATAAAVSGSDVTVKSVTAISATKIHLRVAVAAGATPGPRAITVTLAGGQQASGTLMIG